MKLPAIGYREPALSAILASVFALSSCGGQGGGTGVAQPSRLTSATVSIAPPTGFVPPSGGLTLSGGLFGKAAIQGSSASIKAWDSGRELVGVLDSKGNPLMLGWVGDGNNTITPRTTADVLTYFAIEGYSAPAQNQEALVTAISQQSGGNTVATDIANDLKSGKNLGSAGVTFAAPLQALALSLVNKSPVIARAISGSTVRTPAVKASPTTAQSGITLVPDTTADSLVASNALRRRVLLFVDRSDTFDGSQPPVLTPAALSVAQLEIAPAAGGVNSSGVLGNLGPTATVSTPTIDLPKVPAPQFGATYDVVAVGAGASNSAPTTLDSSELAAKDAFLKKSFFLDFFLPVLNRICISNTLTQTAQTPAGLATLANQMDTAAASNLSSVTAFVGANFPNAESQMENGDFVGATNSVLATLNANASTYSAVVSYYSNFLQTAEAGNPNFAPSSTSLTGVTLWMSSALKNVDVSNLPIALPQYQGYAQSTEYSSWTLTQTTGAVVSLSPATASITTTVGNDTVDLKASVNFGAAGQPTGSTVFYSWSTPGAHGDMVFPDNTAGTKSEPNSAYNSTEYFADLANLSNKGSDVVTVTVALQLANKTVQQLGSASSTITVNGLNGKLVWPAFYGMRAQNGSIITVQGGSWGNTFQNTGGGSTTVQPVTLGHQTEGFFYNVSPTGPNNSGLGEVALTNKFIVQSPNPEVDAASGATVTVTFFDQDSDTGLPGSPTIGTSQDIHLFSAKGVDLGVVIPKFTSTVGDSQGSFDNGSGGDWVVTKSFTIP